MSSCINNISGVVIDPHGFTSRNGNACAAAILDRNGAICTVVDDVRFLNRWDNEVVARCRRAGQV